MEKRFLIIVLSLSSFIFSFAQELHKIEDKKPFQITGSLMTSLNYNESSNSFQSYEPFSYLVSVNLTPSIYGFSIPLSATYSKMNKSFNQPFYRFGLSPTYKWAKLNLGYRTTNFSKYTVSGQNSLGAGIELNPKKFRVGFMYGKFRRNKGFKTTNTTNYSDEDYSRKGFAAKLGYGTNKNYLDLVFSRIADDKDDYDINSTNSIYPESNVIASAISEFSISKYFKFKVEAAASIFTQNMLADNFDENDIPSQLQNLGDFFNINSSSTFAMAKDVSVDYHNKKITIGLNYQRVDPEYQSLGTYFIRNDFENIAVNAGYKLKKGNIGGSLGFVKDNLKNTKIAQTNRVMSRLNIALNPTEKFSVVANYSNFSTKQTEGRVPLNDTIRLYQVNKNISISPQLRFIKEKHSNIIMANFVFAEMNDKNAFNDYSTPVLSKTAFIQHMYRSNIHNYGISTNVNYIDFEAINSRVTNIGPTISLDKSILKKKGLIRIGMSYLWSDNNDVKGKVISGQTSFNYKISKKQKLKLNFSLTDSNYPDNSTVKEYNSQRGTLTYIYQL